MDLTNVTYCGLYCKLCASRGRIGNRAAALRDSIVKEGYDFFHDDIPAFAGKWQAFREILDYFVDRPCPGCRAGGGYPACPVRICAREKGVTVCAACADFPCAHVEMLKVYPTLKADNARIKEIGLEAWIAEQEERAATAFCYADIRHPRAGQPLSSE